MLGAMGKEFLKAWEYVTFIFETKCLECDTNTIGR